MRITDAPDDLVAAVMITSTGLEYAAEYCSVGEAVPLERRVAARALRSLADALDAEADKADGL